MSAAARAPARIAGQSGALARAGARELAFGLRGASREVARWRMLAREIPDPLLQQDALAAITRKRGNIHGAALFWTLPARREAALLRTLVAWEMLADYLDCVNERAARRGVANGRQLHLALSDALQLSDTTSDYYKLNGAHEDGGYATALVGACRDGCSRLPSYEPAAPQLLRAAELTAVLAINHEPDRVRREAALRAWAQRELPDGELAWFECTAGASAWLTVFAILALAAEGDGSDRERAPAHRVGEERTTAAQRTYEVYLRWVCPVGAMLDSYGDIAEDEASGDHSYIAHYGSVAEAVERIAELIGRARAETATLPSGERHALILACMIAFYLSKDSARSPELREGTRALLAASGGLARMLLPVLRGWRTAYGQRAA